MRVPIGDHVSREPGRRPSAAVQITQPHRHTSLTMAASTTTTDTSSGPPTTITAKKEILPPSLPPVEAAARRLERLFGGTDAAVAVASATATKPTKAATASKTVPHYQQPMNNARLLKKWLGSSSGAATTCTLASVAACAYTTLDGSGLCATGRDILMGLCEEGGEDGWVLIVEESRVAARAIGQSKMAAGGAAGDDKGKNEKTGEAGKDSETMDVDINTNEPTTTPLYLVKSQREVEAWLLTLAIRILWRDSKYDEAYELCGQALRIMDAHLAECDVYANILTNANGGVGGGRISQAVNKSPGGLQPLLARLLRYRSLIIESLPNKSAINASLREELAGRHRMAVLRNDGDVMCVVLNLMLRDLLEGDQVEQAQKLLSNSTFPTEAPPSNNQLIRYLYYSGRIQALRLEYTQSYSNLSQALRKSPTNTALGFRIAIQRSLVVVQLLMGEIPERSVFFGEGMQGEMKPYLEIAQAVRRGDLGNFHVTVTKHAERFKLDGMYTLISRLAHSVVKAGLRKLKSSYSRISLVDVAVRLGLPSATSAEFVVAKAVRDGVIDATIDHEEGYVQSHDLVDVYATVEPSEAFHRRIAYCLTTHNDAVRGMRYHEDAYKRQLEASRGLKKRGEDAKTDEDLAAELEDMDEDY